jgi:hypothetical protein
MSFLSILIMVLSFVAGLFAVRELKILAEGDAERYQIVRAISLITMTIAPYLMPERWNHRYRPRRISGTSSFFRSET